jgi:PAS domain S-box-containing protein
MKEARDTAVPNGPVQTTNQSGESADVQSYTWREYERTPTDGQACIVDRAGDIIWTNASWHRNGSPLPIPLKIGGNYGEICRANRTTIANAAMLETAVESLLDSSSEHFDLEVHCISSDGATSGTGPHHHHHCLVRGPAIASDRRVILFHEDVTQSRIANAELHASEERYREFFEAAPDAVFLLSGSPEDTGRVLDANNKAAEDHGYTRDELLGMYIGDLDVHEDAALVKQRVATLFKNGSIAFQVRHRRRDGSEFPVEVTACVASIGGNPIILSFNRDVSERQDYEDALRENKLHIDLAVRASQVGFWHWNLCDNTVIFSPEWKAQIGYEPHEIEDNFEEWRSRVHPDDLESAMRAVNNHIDGVSAEYTTEFRFQHKDGSYR